MIRALIVDDDFRVAQVHAGLRRARAGLRVVGQAHTASAALDAVVAHRPDLVLLDIYLPDASGLESCAALPFCSEPPDVIVLTAARDMAQRARGDARRCRGSSSSSRSTRTRWRHA